jgi:hypothetical protein
MHDDDVTARDDESRYHEERQSYQRDIYLPVPGTGQIYPALLLACNRDVPV